jgi:PucR family transcriptional regulator, purine catabolism regulatory protein
LLHLVSRSIAGRFHSAVAVVDAGAIVVLAPTAKKSAEFATALATTVSSVITQAVQAQPLVIIGPICETLEDYRRARRDCWRATAAADVLGRTGPVSLAELGPYRFLVSVDNVEDAHSFVDETLGSLFTYERSRDGELIRTLRTYFRSNGALQATASELSIHVSTLRYRLERIESLANIELANPETRFSLQLALRFEDLSRSGRSNDE